MKITAIDSFSQSKATRGNTLDIALDPGLLHDPEFDNDLMCNFIHYETDQFATFCQTEAEPIDMLLAVKRTSSDIYISASVTLTDGDIISCSVVADNEEKIKLLLYLLDN